jgi:hypothetical protein
MNNTNLVNKYHSVLINAYSIVSKDDFTRKEASEQIRTVIKLPHSALMWTILKDQGIITVAKQTRIIKWVGGMPDFFTSEALVTELRKRNHASNLALSEKRIEAAKQEQIPEPKPSIDFDFKTVSILEKPTIKTMSINGATISVPEGTKLALDQNGCLTITL